MYIVAQQIGKDSSSSLVSSYLRWCRRSAPRIAKYVVFAFCVLVSTGCSGCSSNDTSGVQVLLVNTESPRQVRDVIPENFNLVYNVSGLSGVTPYTISLRRGGSEVDNNTSGVFAIDTSGMAAGTYAYKAVLTAGQETAQSVDYQLVIDKNDAPEFTGTLPLATMTDKTTPTVTISYSDPESDTIQAVVVRYRTGGTGAYTDYGSYSATAVQTVILPTLAGQILEIEFTTQDRWGAVDTFVHTITPVGSG